MSPTPDRAATNSAEAITPELAAYYGDRGLMWRNLGLILLLNAGWSVCFQVVSPLIQLRLNKMGVNPEWLGVLSGVNSWVYSYAVMYFAWKSDRTVTRFGRRIPYLFLSAPMIIFAIVLFPFVTWIWLLVALALLQMLFMDVKAATIPLLNIDCMPRRLLARTAVPSAIAMACINFAGMRYGMRLSDWWEMTPYLLGAIILTATTLIGGFLIKEPPVKVVRTREKFRPWSAMKVAWKNPNAIVLMIAVSLFQTFIMVYGVWTWLYAKNTLHLSRTDTGLAISWGILAAIVVSGPIGWLVDKFSPYQLLPWFCALGGVALWVCLHITGAMGLIALACLMAPLSGLYNSADIMVYRNAHPSEIGSVTSTNACLRGFYNGCWGIFAGTVIEKTGGHYDYAFILAYAMSCLGLIPLFLYRRLISEQTVAVTSPHLSSSVLDASRP